MGEIISIEHIDHHVDVSTWEEAIQAAGELLVRTGNITELYIQKMINSVQQLGPYIVLMPGFALAHAAPGDYVNHLSMSLITLRHPIHFGSDNDPVKVVLCLACCDQHSHLESLYKIAEKLMAENMIEKLYQCLSKEEIYRLINQ